ncbi:DUF7715 family protein [Paramicrobacterium chengjingii]|uniref:DUF7715 domain-containing protein n=1 Tax=Paramicrobacterium chengjingii TaxID=2769067 RepID=A0ABX6YHM8_9MICO|nr:hypothetical protein [Microbacterium chengjingii]QPZ37877.1 hypothetical protein HCR76_13840 [Microbacterium chengjingii]
MKVLIATTDLQGENPDDFMRAVPGELVVDVGPCQDATAIDDWSCACARSFVGVSSGHMTTTAKVVDNVAVDLRPYEAAVKQGLSDWCCPECARDIARASRIIATQWNEGTVLERNRSTIRARERRPIM